MPATQNCKKMNFKSQKEGKPHFGGIFARRDTSPKPPMTDLNTLAGSKKVKTPIFSNHLIDKKRQNCFFFLFFIITIVLFEEKKTLN